MRWDFFSVGMGWYGIEKPLTCHHLMQMLRDQHAQSTFEKNCKIAICGWCKVARGWCEEPAFDPWSCVCMRQFIIYACPQKLMPIEMHWRNKNNPNKNTDKHLVFLDLSCHEVSAFIFNASSRKKDYISCLSINKYCLLIMACFKFNCMNSKLTIKQWRWGLQYGLENRFQVASD